MLRAPPPLFKGWPHEVRRPDPLLRRRIGGGSWISQSPHLPPPTITNIVMAIGVALLVVSLAARHIGAPEAVAAITSWLGAIMVIVGVGKWLFLDE